jgi:hypothetical protein
MPIWRNPNELQLGESTNAIRITGLSPGQERLIKLLYRGVADSYYKEVAAAVGANEPEQLLKQIEPALLKRAGEPTSLSAQFITDHFAEICRAQATHNTEGEVVIDSRRRATVFIENCHGVTKTVANALSNSGVGTIVLEKLEDLELDCKTINLGEMTDAQIDQIDFAILISNNAVSPRSYARWLGRNVPHLSIVFDSEGASISPTIRSAKNPCLNCFHENKTSTDSSWPAVASQLLFSQQRFDDVSASYFAASIASQRALHEIDVSTGIAEETQVSAGYRLSMNNAEISEFSWQFNDSCKCRGY